LVVLGLCVLIAVACGGDPDERVEAAIATDQASPLAVLFGVSLDVDPLRGAAGAEVEIADCMARAGFEYSPAAVIDGIGSTPRGTPQLSDVQTSGYGIADSVSTQIALFQGASADPNDAYLETLSAQEIQEYQAALTGITAEEIVFDDSGTPVDAVSGEPASPAQIRAASDDGCASMAYADLLDPAGANLLSSDVYLEAQQIIEADNEMQALTAEWSRCMANAGYPVRDQAELIRDLDTEADNIVHESIEDHHDVDADEVDAMIDRLRAREITIALIDFDCSAELFEAAPEITRRVESDFIRDNEDRLIDLLEQQP